MWSYSSEDSASDTAYCPNLHVCTGRMGCFSIRGSPAHFVRCAMGVRGRPISQADEVILVAGWKQDALAACMAARTHTSAPIVLLADDTSSRAVVEGLRAGADLVVPMDTPPTELQARIRAILRRQRAAPAVDPFHVLRLSDSGL